MKMRSGNNGVDFYFFWRWQYIRRKKHSGIDLNPYAQQIESNLKAFEQQHNNTLTSDDILRLIAKQNFIYTYPDCIEYGGITVLDKSIFSDKFDDEMVSYDDDGSSMLLDYYKYIEGNCHLVLINMNTPIDVIIADIKNLLQGGSQARERAFIEHRGVEIEDYYKAGKDKARAIGLWIWDRVNQYGGNRGDIKRAIDDLYGTNLLLEIGLDDIADTTLNFYHRKTNCCIESGEVLPFTSRKARPSRRRALSGTKKSKLVPGTKTAR